MTWRVSLLLASLAVLPPAGSALAQTSTRTFVQGFAGGSLGTESASVYGATAGIAFGRFRIAGEVGRFESVVPKSLREYLDVATHYLGFLGDTEYELRYPAWYGLTETRVSLLRDGVVWPYASAGVGVARLMPHVRLISNGHDMTRSTFDESRLTNEFAWLGSVGGGISIRVAKRWTAELGYRHMRIYSGNYKFSQYKVQRVSAGLGLTF